MDKAGAFSDRLAPVVAPAHADTRLFYVASKGTVCGKPVLHHNAYVRENAHYIYIDTQGRVVLEEPFRARDTDARPEQNA